MMSAVSTAILVFGAVIAVIGLLGAVWPTRFIGVIAFLGKWSLT
jgi:hypothetical protein